jgi:hypothetical protein
MTTLAKIEDVYGQALRAAAENTSPPSPTVGLCSPNTQAWGNRDTTMAAVQGVGRKQGTSVGKGQLLPSMGITSIEQVTMVERLIQMQKDLNELLSNVGPGIVSQANRY